MTIRSLKFLVLGSAVAWALSGCGGGDCGDGIVNSDEECDDGNGGDGDGCSAACVFEFCGDGVVNNGEQCDDGNAADGDGCTTACFSEACGNSVVDPGEGCDDGNLVDDDACLANCQPNTCGDGFVNPAAEQCDAGAGNHPTLPGTCRPSCQLPACGDTGLYVGDLGPEILPVPGGTEIVQSNDAPRGIGADASANFTVIWRVNGLIDRLYVQRIDAAGQLLGPPGDLLDPASQEAKDPVIAVRANGVDSRCVGR